MLSAGHTQEPQNGGRALRCLLQQRVGALHRLFGCMTPHAQHVYKLLRWRRFQSATAGGVESYMHAQGALFASQRSPIPHLHRLPPSCRCCRPEAAPPAQAALPGAAHTHPPPCPGAAARRAPRRAAAAAAGAGAGRRGWSWMVPRQSAPPLRRGGHWCSPHTVAEDGIRRKLSDTRDALFPTSGGNAVRAGQHRSAKSCACHVASQDASPVQAQHSNAHPALRRHPPMPRGAVTSWVRCPSTRCCSTPSRTQSLSCAKTASTSWRSSAEQGGEIVPLLPPPAAA